MDFLGHLLLESHDWRLICASLLLAIVSFQEFVIETSWESSLQGKVINCYHLDVELGINDLVSVLEVSNGCSEDHAYEQANTCYSQTPSALAFKHLLCLCALHLSEQDHV